MTIPSNPLFLALMLLICWWVEFVHEGVRSSIRGRTLPTSPETRWCVAPIPRVNLPTEIGGCYFGVRSATGAPNDAKRAASVKTLGVRPTFAMAILGTPGVFRTFNPTDFPPQRVSRQVSRVSRNTVGTGEGVVAEEGLEPPTRGL